jgi:hypothetical protein
VDVEIVAVKSSSNSLSKHQRLAHAETLFQNHFESVGMAQEAGKSLEMLIVQYSSKVYTKTHVQQPWMTEL